MLAGEIFKSLKDLYKLNFSNFIFPKSVNYIYWILHPQPVATTKPFSHHEIIKVFQ